MWYPWKGVPFKNQKLTSHPAKPKKSQSMNRFSREVEDTSGEEFEIKSPEVDPLTILQRLKEFAYYLVENIELKLNLSLSILEEIPVPPKSNSIPTTVVSKLLSAVPKLGTAIGNAFAKGETFFLEKIDKKNAKTLANLVYYYSDNKDDLRRVIIEAAIDLFCSFEYQFLRLTCNAGEKKAMQKLAKDAADRAFGYLLDTEQNKHITKDDITKGVLYGNSKRNNVGIREGRTVTDNGIKWKTHKLYRKTGIVIVDEGDFYKTSDCHTEKYGHRRPLPWEDLNDIMINWEWECGFEVHPYFLTGKEDLIGPIRDYIMTKTPHEDAKLERRLYHDDSSEDRRIKHEELLLTFHESFKEVLENLEQQYNKVVDNHNESKNLLEEISKKQCEEVDLRKKINRKLRDIDDDINETKELVEMHKRVQRNISEIENRYKALQESIIASLNPENVIQVFKSEKINNLNESIVNAVSAVTETFRENDPFPRISREIVRNVDKLRNLF